MSTRRRADSAPASRHAGHLPQGRRRPRAPTLLRAARHRHGAGDLLFHVPHRYEDASTVTPIASLESGMDVTVIGTRDLEGRSCRRARACASSRPCCGRDGHDRSLMARPAVPRPHASTKGDVLLVTGQCASFTAASCSRASSSTSAPTKRGRAQGRVLAGVSGDRGAVVQAHPRAHRAAPRRAAPAGRRVPAGRCCASRRACPASPKRCAWCIGRRRSPRRCAGRSRLAFEELFFVQLLHRRANELAREPRAGIAFATSATLTTQLRESLPFTLTGAQVRAIREIVADMRSDRAHASAAAGRRRQRQDDRRALRGAAGDRERLSGGDHGADRAARRAARADVRRAARAARHRRRFCSPAACGPRERARRRSRLASDEPVLVVGTHALVQEATEFGRARSRRRSTSSIASASSNARRSARRESARRAAHERDADSAFARAHAVRRSRPERARRAAAGPAADHDRCCAASRRATRCIDVRRPPDRRRDARRTSSIRSSRSRRRLDLKAATTMYEELCAGVVRATVGVGAAARAHAAPTSATTIMRRVPRRRDRRAGRDDGDRGGHRRGQRDRDDRSSIPSASGCRSCTSLRGRVGRGAEESYCILLGDVEPGGRRRGCTCSCDTDDGFEIARADLRAARHGRSVRRATERRADVPHRRSRSRRGAERAGA